MKITAELIQHSHQFTNPLNERQLDLRGFKITHIENMGATLVTYFIKLELFRMYWSKW